MDRISWHTDWHLNKYEDIRDGVLLGKFCNVGDMPNADSGCDSEMTTRVTAE